MKYWKQLCEEAKELEKDLRDEVDALLKVVLGLWNLSVQACSLAMSALPYIRSVVKSMKEFKKKL